MAYIPIKVRERIGELSKQAGRCEVGAPEHEHGSFVASVDWVFQFAGLVAADTLKQQECVGWLHRQGNHTELSERPLEDDEIARGWTQEPVYVMRPA